MVTKTYSQQMDHRFAAKSIIGTFIAIAFFKSAFNLINVGSCSVVCILAGGFFLKAVAGGVISFSMFSITLFAGEYSEATCVNGAARDPPDVNVPAFDSVFDSVFNPESDCIDGGIKD